MPADILQAMLAVGPLAPGAQVVVPHTLHNGPFPLVPTIIWPNAPTAIGVLSANSTTITFRNTGATTQSAVFLAQFDHSIQAAFASPIALWWQGSIGGAASNAFASYLFSNTPTQVTDVYVDSVTGDDANDGLTPATALETVNGVYSKFPMMVIGGATLTVHFASGPGGTVADYPTRTIVVNGGDGGFCAYQYRGPQMVLSTLASGPATVVGGLTAVAVGRRTRIDVAPNPGWAANDLRGSFARVTRAGDKVFFELPISENDADSIFIDDLGIVGVLAGTDTLEIVTPGARIVSDVATLQVLITGNSGYMPSPLFWGTPPSCTFERLHFFDFPVSSGVDGMTFDRCKLSNTPFWKGGSVGHVNCIYTDGVKISTMTIEFQVDSRPDGVSDPIDTSVSVEITSFNIFLVGNPDGIGNYIAKRNVSVYGQSVAGRGAIHVVGYGSIFWADDGSLNTDGPVALQGSGNAGPFIWTRHGGQARINTTAGATPFTTGTGTGSPLRVGPNNASNPAIAYGTGVGAFEEVAGFNGNFHRFLNGTAAAPLGDGSRIFLPV